MRFLAAGFEDGAWRIGDRLPPVRELAALARVSVPTMLKAVRELERRGLLHSVPGQALWAGPPSAAQRPAARENPLAGGLAWKRVADELASAIVTSGLDPAGGLPSLKELSGRYGASVPTVRRALRHCAILGLVRRTGRRWRPKTAAAPAEAAMLLIALGEDERSLQSMHQRTAEHLRMVEQNCMAAGVNLCVAPVVHGNGGADRARRAIRRIEAAAAHRAVIGHILWTPLMAAAFRDTIAASLAATGKPLSVFYEWFYGTPYAPRGDRRGMVAQFAVGSHEAAATAVGTYLLRRGHRHIAYLSPYHRNEWSPGRLSTLRSLCEAAGAAVYPYTMDQYENAFEHYLAAEAAGAVRSFNDRYNALDSSGALDPAELRRAWTSTLLPMLIRRAVAANAEPMTLAMLKRRHITACVAANDQAAFLVMDIAAREGIRIPGDLSLIGFDNTVECIDRNLTSYDFNLAAAARATVNHVLTPGRAVRGLPAPLPINGALVHRGSA